MTTMTTTMDLSNAGTAPAPIRTRAAFATLDRTQQRLIDAVLFDGRSCTEIAQAIGAPALEIRSQVSAAMQALRVQLEAHDEHGDRGGIAGAVAGMLVLRALDVLDADEAELVDAMIAHQPALQGVHADDCELVGALCALAPRVAPPPCVLARLEGSLDDDAN